MVILMGLSVQSLMDLVVAGISLMIGLGIFAFIASILALLLSCTMPKMTLSFIFQSSGVKSGKTGASLKLQFVVSFGKSSFAAVSILVGFNYQSLCIWVDRM